jgi:hypothetical protein
MNFIIPATCSLLYSFYYEDIKTIFRVSDGPMDIFVCSFVLHYICSTVLVYDAS